MAELGPVPPGSTGSASWRTAGHLQVASEGWQRHSRGKPGQEAMWAPRKHARGRFMMVLIRPLRGHCFM